MSPLDAEASASETTSAPTQPLSFVEFDDAGEDLDGAVPIVADLVQPLTSIFGSLSGDADLFQIFISGDQPFSATTLSPETLLDLPIDNTLGIPTGLLEDPQLFLFDAMGNGVFGNDDLFGSIQATLPSMANPLDPGIYFLAISGFGYSPVSTGGDIFGDASFDGILPPTGAGGDLPLTGFAGESLSSGDYTIALTGAQTIPPMAPPMAPPVADLDPLPQPLAFVEANDAGEDLNGAVPIVADLVQPLTSIFGSLSGDADLFQIFISGDQPFSATTLSPETLLDIPIDNTLGIPTGLLEDPQLFLFDAMGNGVFGNDDLFGSIQSTLPSMENPLSPGIYFLAISGFGYNPISAGGDIFGNASPDGILPPTGPGGDRPLTGFAGESLSSGDYTIALTGAQTIPPIAPPMPDPDPLPELFDLTGFDSNVAVNVIQQVFREAAFNNVLAFYETDALGRVGGLLPGEAGYEAAVAANLLDGVTLTANNNQTTDVTLDLFGGTYYAPALLIDGNINNLATVGDAALGQARIKREGNMLFFEDLTDFDFNDLIVTLTPEGSAIT